MAGLLQYLVSNYTQILKNLKDPMVDTWFLMGSPVPMLCIVGTYLIFVLSIGPKMMNNRPAFQLNTIMVLYNTFQVLFSIWLTYMLLKLNVQLFSSHGCNDVHRLTSLQRKYVPAAVFMVFRKKQKQLTFLHVYHHTITVITSWCFLSLLPGEQGPVIAIANSVVHIIMYSYYLIAALGLKRHIWWKRYITWIQLSHFGLLLFYLILTLVLDCQMSKVLTYFFLIIFLIFIFLFSDFYQKAYNKKKTI